MNPFTRFLLRNKPKETKALKAFVERWDVLEALVIQVFKNKAAETADEKSYKEIQTWLADNYSLWENELRPYWQTTKVGGQLTQQDPFLRLTTAKQAQDFIGDWEAMQYLPAAREALNRYIQTIAHRE